MKNYLLLICLASFLIIEISTALAEDVYYYTTSAVDSSKSYTAEFSYKFPELTVIENGKKEKIVDAIYFFKYSDLLKVQSKIDSNYYIPLQVCISGEKLIEKRATKNFSLPIEKKDRIYRFIPVENISRIHLESGICKIFLKNQEKPIKGIVEQYELKGTADMGDFGKAQFSKSGPGEFEIILPNKINVKKQVFLESETSAEITTLTGKKYSLTNIFPTSFVLFKKNLTINLDVEKIASFHLIKSLEPGFYSTWLIKLKTGAEDELKLSHAKHLLGIIGKVENHPIFLPWAAIKNINF